MDNNSIKRKLFDVLKEFNPDKDFVGGVISYTKNDEDRQKIIDFFWFYYGSRFSYFRHCSTSF